MESISADLAQITKFIWGWPLIFLLFGTHLFLTVRLGFIQRFIGHGIRLSFKTEEKSEGDISHFASLATALAATIGTGNIVGVATAVAAGGPGAVLWMWLTGVFGIATKYGEAVLAVKYRVKLPNGHMAGGPMYALEHGLGCKWLGVLFAIFTVIASFGIGNMTQSHSIADLAKTQFALDPRLTGITLALLTAAVILGGLRSISRVCSFLVPIMALVYVVGCLILLFLHADRLPGALQLIVTSAFTGQAALGGFLGAGIKEAMRYGIARGLFSNESGMGSAPIVAAAAKTNDPVKQGLVSATGTFWDTVVICALTGLIIVASGDWQQGIKGVELTRSAFAHMGSIGPTLLTFGLLTFVLSTILGWSYYGEKAAEYLLGSRALLPYRLLWVVAVYVGATSSLNAVWDFSDIANALMTVPNLIALLLLSGVIASETRAYFQKTTPAPTK
jgi:AGCS family alanine or glycine:cation symporter